VRTTTVAASTQNDSHQSRAPVVSVKPNNPTVVASSRQARVPAAPCGDQGGGHGVTSTVSSLCPIDHVDDHGARRFPVQSLSFTRVLPAVAVRHQAHTVSRRPASTGSCSSFRYRFSDGGPG
jgi:hypothetical protein